MPATLHLLFVEDRKSDFQLAHHALKRHNPEYKIGWVKRGEDAIRYLQDGPINVAILDHDLPGMSGLDTLKEMKANAFDIPTVFVTGNGSEETAVRALKLGAQDYLVKDGSGDYLHQLPKVINQVFSQHQAQQARKKVTAALQRRDERLRATIASMDDLVFVIDKKGAFLSYYQPPGKYSLSASPEFFLGKSFEEVLPAHVTHLIKKALDKARTTNEPQHFEYALPSVSQLFWFSAKLTVQRDRHGHFNGATIVVRDISEQKKAEALLRHYNQELETQVKVRTAELTEANKKLQKLDQLKTKLINDMAHELRTPVTNIKLYLELIQQGNTSDKGSHYFKIVTEQAERLDQLINTVATFSEVKAQSDAEKKEQALLNLTNLVHQVIEWHLPASTEKGLSIDLVGGEKFLLIYGDQQQLITVISNLLKNSINYTTQGGIKVSVNNAGKDAILEVTDTGLGIPGDELAHIFQRFYRGKQISQLTTPGTGIGLALVKEIVSRHQGAIEVTSEPGVGTTFTVKLPLVKRR